HRARGHGTGQAAMPGRRSRRLRGRRRRLSLPLRIVEAGKAALRARGPGTAEDHAPDPCPPPRPGPLHRAQHLARLVPRVEGRRAVGAGAGNRAVPGVPVHRFVQGQPRAPAAVARGKRQILLPGLNQPMNDRKPRIVALLPMKAHSERVKGKNFRVFCGKPLFRWILDTLLEVDEIDEVVINTDARHILAENGLVETDRITIRDRKPEICGDMVSMNLVLADDVGNVDADIYLMTHTTNPLVSADTIRTAIAADRD